MMPMTTITPRMVSSSVVRAFSAERIQLMKISSSCQVETSSLNPVQSSWVTRWNSFM